MTHKQKAIETILNMMDQHDISVNEIKQSLRQKDTKIPIIIKLLAYLGGVLILVGVSTYATLQWEFMTSFSRVLITLGTGFVAYIVALLILTEERFKSLVTPLFIISALLECTGLSVLLNEYFTPTGVWEPPAMFVTGCLVLQFGFTWLALKKSVLLFITLIFLFTFIGAGMSWLNIDHDMNAFLIGLMMVSLSFLMVRTRYVGMTPIGYFVGAVLLLFGLFELVVENILAELLYVLINIGLIYFSISQKSRTLLFVSILGIFGYLSYAAFRYFSDALGWPILFIGLGLLLFVISFVGIKIHENYFHRNP